ncbi:hypothetical protein IWZ01DRAFT_486238 [Phyllosticta capitalensis]
MSMRVSGTFILLWDHTNNSPTDSQRSEPNETNQTTDETAPTHPGNLHNPTPIHVHLSVTVNVFPVDNGGQQENAPTSTHPVNLEQALPEIVSRSGILETALRLLVENMTTNNTLSSNDSQQRRSTESETSREVPGEHQRNEITPPETMADLDPAQFGFILIDPEASHDDENTLYWRQQRHAHSGSAAEGSFSGPYTRNEMLEIISEETT